MTANSTIYTKEENNALLISAKATKFKPDSSMMKKYTIVDDRSKEVNNKKIMVQLIRSIVVNLAEFFIGR
jgi:HlyD family secretion protein